MLRTLDKIEKEEGAKIREELERDGLSRAGAAQLFGLISSRRGTDETLSVLQEMKSCAQGLQELRQIVEAIRQFGARRGLRHPACARPRLLHRDDLRDHARRVPELGSICSGARCDDLASYFTDTRLPGSASRSGSRAFSPSQGCRWRGRLPRCW